jgi:multiple sugar transport system substrate-binding protein
MRREASGPTQEREWSRRRLLGWARAVGAAGGAAGGLALASCAQGQGAGEAPPAQSAAPVTIRHMPWNAAKDIQAPQDVVPLFAAKHPRITVQVEPPGGNIYQKLETLFAADQEPDVFYLQGWMWQSYAVRGSLLDLAPLLRRDRAFPAGAVFARPHLEQTHWQDRTYMVPNDTGGFVLFFNRELFERSGVAVPNDTWTWDDWQSAAERLTRGDGDAKVFGYEAQENWRRNSYWIKQTGKEPFDRISGPGACLMDDPAVVEAVQRQVDTVQRLRIAPKLEDQATIYNGRAAMKVEGDWTMWTYKQDGRIRWDVAPLPRHKRRATVLLVHGSSAAARTRHREAAWEWLKFYTTEEAQRAHVLATGRVTITPELARRIFVPYAKQEFAAEHPEVFLTRWEYGSHWGVSDALDEAERDAINPAFQAAFRGEQPVATALREAARKATDILKASRMAAAR